MQGKRDKHKIKKALSTTYGIEIAKIENWMSLTGISTKEAYHFLSLADNERFGVEKGSIFISRQLPYSSDMLEVVSKNNLVGCYSEDSQLALREMSAPLFKVYVNSRINRHLVNKDPLSAIVEKLAYIILKYTERKTEADYVLKLPNMRNTYLRKTVNGGKLLRMANQYQQNPLKEKFIK